MRIRSIHLRDFKRFTDLKISELPETATLIVLIGPNGCGKSSVFDALHGKAVVEHYWGWLHEQLEYWNKTYSVEDEKNAPTLNLNPGQKITIDFHGSPPTDPRSWAQAVHYSAVVKAIVDAEIILLRDRDNLSEREGVPNSRGKLAGFTQACGNKSFTPYDDSGARGIPT